MSITMHVRPDHWDEVQARVLHHFNDGLLLMILVQYTQHNMSYTGLLSFICFPIVNHSQDKMKKRDMVRENTRVMHLHQTS